MIPSFENLSEYVIHHIVRNRNFCGYPVKPDDITPSMLEKGWIYYRPFGLFRVFSSGHVFVQSYLYALSNVDKFIKKWNEEVNQDEYRNFERFFRETYDENWEDYSEYFIEIPGTAFYSNVSFGNFGVVGKKNNLTRKEFSMLSVHQKIITLKEYDTLRYAR